MDFNLLFPENIVFGAGRLRSLPKIISETGNRILLVTGKSSFLASRYWDVLSNQFSQGTISCKIAPIPGEPSPGMIDKAVAEFQDYMPEVVVAIGGGSVLDAGKAISAMLPIHEPVKKYLEGVGDGGVHPGKKIPFIAVPTTAGTGSEATKNAVISQIGVNGFKKSLRHNNFIPDIALIDPELCLNCPEHITAWSGMDAFTQLLESYLSTNANPMTDSLALSGMGMVSKYLERVVHDGNDLEARSGMAYAALCSGITLANAGLGTVHGFASSIGGRFDIPHGLVCASLMGPTNEMTFNTLMKNDPDSPFIKKYARAGKLFFGSEDRDDVFYSEFLINKIHDLSLAFNLPKLNDHGFDPDCIEEIIAKTSNKYNPVQLLPEELNRILEKAV